MKIVYIECDAEEMRANRTFMDALKDVAYSIVNVFNSSVDKSEEDISVHEDE